jgi:hypothetical protein
MQAMRWGDLRIILAKTANPGFAVRTCDTVRFPA